MKYIKYFESKTPNEEIKENRDNIIKVLSEYAKLYNDDSLVSEMFELIWSESEEAGNRVEDNGNEIDEESIRLLVDDIIDSSIWGRTMQKLLDIYYDCNYVLSHNDDSVVDNIKDIFAEYFDDNKAKFYKTSDKNDNRYIVLIDQIDVLLTLDFKEIINRVNNIVGLKYMSYSGVADQIKFEFHEPYPDDED